MADRFSIPGTPFRWDERFETGDPYKTYDNYCDPFPAGTLIAGNTYYNGSVVPRRQVLRQHRAAARTAACRARSIVGLTDEIDFTRSPAGARWT